MNPGFQLGDVVSVVSERPLGDDLPAVERRIDIVDRHTEDLDAVFQRRSMACAPRNAGSSEGWMLTIRPP